MIPPILPFLVRETGLSLALAGTLVSVKSLVSGFLQPFFGRLVERRGRGWMLPLSVAWVAGAMMLFAGFNSFGALAALVVAAGLGGAFYHPLAAMMTRAAAGPSGSAMSVFFLGGTVGMAAAPWLTAVAVARWGRAGVALAAASALLAAAAGWLGRLDRIQPAGSVRDRVSGGTQASAGEGGAPPGFVPPRARRSFTAFAAANFLRVQAQVAFTTFLPYLYVARGYPDEVGGRMLTLFYMVGSASSLLGGWLGDRIGYRPVMMASFVLSGAALFAFARWPEAHLPFLVLSALALLAPFSVCVLYGQRLLPANPGLAAGVMMGLIWGLSGLGLSVISAAADTWGVEALLAWMPWLPLAAVPLMVGVPAPGAPAARGAGARSEGSAAGAAAGAGVGAGAAAGRGSLERDR